VIGMNQRRISRRSGLALVESAFVMAMCLLLLFGIFEYGRFVMTKQVLDNAAREGARWAVVNTQSGTTAQAQNVVNGYLAGQGAQLQSFSKTTSIQVYRSDSSGSPIDASNNVVSDWTLAPFTNAQFGDSITVKISGNYKPVIPVFLFMPGTIQMQGVAVMKSEAN